MLGLRFGPLDALHARFVRAAKRHWGSFCMADSSGKELTYGRTLIGSLVLSRWVRANCRGEATPDLSDAASDRCPSLTCGARL